MAVKKFNISKPSKYEDREGNEKTKWDNIGTITEFHKEDGSVSKIIEIPAIGLKANIFPFVERDDRGDYGNNSRPKSQRPKTKAPSYDEEIDGHIEYPNDDISPSDIPF